jgi:hypothetical protein
VMVEVMKHSDVFKQKESPELQSHTQI